MKPSRYVPGAWKGEPEGLRELTEDEWQNITHKSRTEIEADERKQREQSKTTNTTEPL